MPSRSPLSPALLAALLAAGMILPGCTPDPTRDAAPPPGPDARPATPNPDKMRDMPSATQPVGGSG